jgi:hypothetical protein
MQTCMVVCRCNEQWWNKVGLYWHALSTDSLLQMRITSSRRTSCVQGNR